MKIIKHIIIGLLLLSVVIFEGCSKPKIITTESLAEIALKSTVAITMQDKDRRTYALGSGAIVNKGAIVTNFHVIAGAPFGFVQLTNDEKKHNIEGYYAIDSENDIAIIYVPTIQEKGFIIQTGLPKIGEKIFTVGNPHGLAGTFSEGNVSSIRAIENNKMIQITAPISPGSSGGPVLNSNAELIGIAIGSITEGQNLNFAIPSLYIEPLIKAKTVPKKLNSLISKNNSSAIKDNTLINGLMIRKVKREINFDGGGTGISEFSIYNKLDVSVNNIKIMFIVYDNEGVPVDYDIITLLPDGDGVIVPGLAQTFRIGYRPPIYDWIPEQKYELKLIFYKGYSSAYRILDFNMYN